jgi:hypothetical protein
MPAWHTSRIMFERAELGLKLQLEASSQMRGGMIALCAIAAG